MLSVGPVLAAQHRPQRADRERQSEQCEQCLRTKADRPERHRDDPGEDERQGELPAREPPPEHHGERALARDGVRLDVADVVHDQDRGDREAHRHGRRQHLEGEYLRLHVVGAADGDEAEEDEREDLAEAAVAEGPRAAGVGDRREDRADSRGDHGPARDGSEVDADQRRDGEGDPHRGQHLALAEQPELGDARRADPLRRVGPAAEVGDIVREVRADLDRDRAEQRGKRRPEAEATVVDGDPRADSHRRDGGCQRRQTRG